MNPIVSPAAGLRYAPIEPDNPVTMDRSPTARRRRNNTVVGLLMSFAVAIGLLLVAPVTTTPVGTGEPNQTVLGGYPDTAGAIGSVKVLRASPGAVSVRLYNGAYSAVYPGETMGSVTQFKPPNFDGNQWRARWHCVGSSRYYIATNWVPVTCNVEVTSVYPPG